MITRCFLVIALIVAGTAAAHAESKVLVLASRVTDNVSYYRPGSYTKTAFTIPAGKALLGLGAGTTTIFADASVTSGNFIQSTGYGGSATTSYTVSGLRIESNDVLTESIQGNQTEQDAFDAGQFQEIGVAIDALEVGRIHDCEIEGFRNYGAVITGTGTHRKLSIDFNKFYGNWHGFQLITDSSATGNLVAGALERGIDLHGGAIQLTANHAYGMKYALHCAPGFAAGGILSTNERYEDSQYGIYFDGNVNVAHFNNVKLYHNFVCGAWIEGTRVTFRDPMVDVPHSSPPGGGMGAPWPDKVGIEFAGASNEIFGGLINLENFTHPNHGAANPSTCVRVSGNNCRIDTTLYDQDGIVAGGSRGLHIPSQIRGGEFTYRIYGFETAGDAALDIDTNDFSGVRVLIVGNSTRSPGFKYNDAVQYVDVPAGWGIDGAMTGTPQLTFSASARTITRNGGSWTADGFNIGETVTVTGTTNNNISGEAITNVNATVLTLGNTTLVDEVDTTNAVSSKNGSVIEIMDEASGQVFTLTPNTAY
jgi:hypothetical protein